MISITTVELSSYPAPSQSLAAFPIDPAQSIELELELKTRISLQWYLKLWEIANFISESE